jgi:integrase/recombinase XerD
MEVPMFLDPCLVRFDAADGGGHGVRLGHRLLDDYLELVAARARPNTLLAAAWDLKVFFSVVAKDPVEVTTADVLAFITAQRAPRRGPRVVRLEDGEAGLAARTIKRRLASVSGLFTFLVVRGDVAANPVPQGLAARRPGQRPVRAVPLIRAPRTLPRVLDPGDVNAFLAALRTRRDRAMVEAMLLGALRRCEVLGLRIGDLRPGERRVCRSPRGSLPPWPTTWPPSAPQPAPTGCSSCSKAPIVGGRCQPPGWTRSSALPAGAPGSPS